MGPTWRDVLLAICVFWLPAAAIYMTLILREVRRLWGEWRALEQELRTTSAEGFPPPGPPTTDSLSDQADTLEAPPTAEPR